MSRNEDKAEGRRIGPEHQLSAPPPWYHQRWVVWTGLLLLLLLIGIAVAIIHHNSVKEAAAQRAKAAIKPPVTATVATATKGSIGVYLDALGTVTPVYTSSITAQASGVITAVHYTEGQLVRTGDALTA